MFLCNSQYAVYKSFIILISYLYYILSSMAYSNGGGGGERVLWIAIQSLFQRHSDDLTIFIYSKPLNKEELISHVKSRFNLDFTDKIDRIVIVPIVLYKLLDPSKFVEYLYFF